MKAFLLKYKRTIIFWIVFLFVILYFVPRQSDYYLDNDIKYFKSHYLTPTLIWTGIVITILLLLMLFIKTKSIKQSSLSFLYGTVTVACFLFIFQNLFLATALFINRQIIVLNKYRVETRNLRVQIAAGINYKVNPAVMNKSGYWICPIARNCCAAAVFVGFLANSSLNSVAASLAKPLVFSNAPSTK